MLNYNHNQIEKKWQDYWDENKTFKTNDNLGQKKFYALDMFPYPSGAGLHVGHPEGYTPSITSSLDKTVPNAGHQLTATSSTYAKPLLYNCMKIHCVHL